MSTSPYDETAPAITQLKEMGAPVEFVTIQEITHFNTAGFVKPLRETIPWLREIKNTRRP